MSLACRLGNNSLRDEGTIAICNALSENKASKLQELNLTSNGITEMGAKSVAAYLAVTASLTALDVRYNSLGNEGKALLQQAVQGRSGFDLKM